MQSKNGNKKFSEMPVCYPFVKWSGAKKQLLSELCAFVPAEFETYFEPFLGRGAMFFYLISDKNRQFTAYLSDINHELINLYLAVKNDVEGLIRTLEIIKNEYDEAPKDFHSILQYSPYSLTSNNKLSSDTKAAARYLALNRTCAIDIFRLNGNFNPRWGLYKEHLTCNTENLRKASIALRNAKVITKFSEYKNILLENAKPGDFIYLDPPFGRIALTEYFLEYRFDDEDLRTLAGVYKELDDRECKVLLTAPSTPLVKDLFADFAGYTIEVRSERSSNHKGSKGERNTDLIIRNYS
jgi:DNA adenine methylase